MKHCHKQSCLVSCTLMLAGVLAAGPVAAKVVVTFTGTVTEVAGTVTPPSGVEVGNAVSGTVSYIPAAATMFEVGPSEREYAFPAGAGNEFTVSIGALTWKTDLQVVYVCDDACDSDFLDFTGLSTTTENFPDNVGAGYLFLEFSDSEAPYGLVNGHDLPNAAEDVNFAAAIVKSGLVSSNGPAGLWAIVFDVDSPTVPTTSKTWGEVKALYARP